MKRDLSPEELHLWQSQLKGVAPLSKAAKIPEGTAVLKKPKPPQPQHRPLKDIPPPSSPLQNLGRKELRHLKIDGRLDLHGMTMAEGYDALERFLRQAQEKGFKTVLIITGKGAINSKNTLRHQLPRWIKETPLHQLISAFHSPAKQRDGGLGACYLMIRKRSF